MVRIQTHHIKLHPASCVKADITLLIVDYVRHKWGVHMPDEDILTKEGISQAAYDYPFNDAKLSLSYPRVDPLRRACILSQGKGEHNINTGCGNCQKV